jgi:hypothetical protein
MAVHIPPHDIFYPHMTCDQSADCLSALRDPANTSCRRPSHKGKMIMYPHIDIKDDRYYEAAAWYKAINQIVQFMREDNRFDYSEIKHIALLVMRDLYDREKYLAAQMAKQLISDFNSEPQASDAKEITS